MLSFLQDLDFVAVGEGIHTFAVSFLFFSLYFNKGSLGVSAKTQILFLVSIIAKSWYVIQLGHYEPIYWWLQFSHIAFTWGTLLFLFISRTANREDDTFWSELVILPAIFTSVLASQSLLAVDLLYTFSQFLKCVAVIPQMYLILKTKKISNTIAIYLFAMGFQDWIAKYSTLGFNQTTDITSFIYLGVYTVSVMIMLHSGVQMYSSDDGGSEQIYSLTSEFVDDCSDTALLINGKEDDLDCGQWQDKKFQPKNDFGLKVSCEKETM
ncbi:ER lumen protein-retaining receptor erd-2.2 [Diabrotica virgifera virgifera]|uniref:ER lumen protein-retaining receptor C28H8.4 n=1 Tax=Diabrotica virgifera virgifera TaxID=50390 RepID=A0A6P7FA78_DIAVI|nr:ER lumen protein-retaining receptor erd-2.2 [Diabrotica virgifera virgifera]